MNPKETLKKTHESVDSEVPVGSSARAAGTNIYLGVAKYTVSLWRLGEMVKFIVKIWKVRLTLGCMMNLTLMAE